MDGRPARGSGLLYPVLHLVEEPGDGPDHGVQSVLLERVVPTVGKHDPGDRDIAPRLVDLVLDGVLQVGGGRQNRQE